MNSKAEIERQEFEWDEEKNRININKHGISFKSAKKVFLDPARIEYYDYEHSLFEDRYKVIGYVRNCLCVIYTNRDTKIRIISARKANEEERSIYYGNRI